jgi:type IV pilus assembly protein PilC
MVVQMVSVGEETGALDNMLAKIADFYEEEVDTAVEGLTSIIEPILIIFLGVTVGFMVIAMFMPMFSMGDLVS